MHWLRFLFVLFLLSSQAGCLMNRWFDRDSPSRPIAGYDGPTNLPTFPKAEVQNASRVDLVGRKLLAANPKEKLNPLFLTVGSQEKAVFHKGTTEIYITEGLVQACETDAALAAVLATEFAAMKQEKQAQAALQGYRNAGPPPAPRLTPDIAGSGMAPDMTRLAEVAKWEERNPRPETLATPTETPEQLAVDLMLQAGYSQEEYRKHCAMVRQARRNSEKEKERWLR